VTSLATRSSRSATTPSWLLRNLKTLPIGPWAGLRVLVAWAMAALLPVALLLRLRDA
jgi:hypothetical protein